MNLREAEKEALELLYKTYLERPGTSEDIAPIAQKHGVDAFKFGNHLSQRGFVRNKMNLMPSIVQCEISLTGVDEIDPDYIPEMKNKIIDTLGIQGGRQDAFEVLDLEKKDSVRVRQIVNYMADLGLLNKPDFLGQEILIELSLQGQEYYNNQKGGFFG